MPSRKEFAVIPKDQATREKIAAGLENHRTSLMEDIERYPHEIEYGSEKEGTYWRVVLQKPKEVDVLIHQIRQPTLAAEEALNTSLAH